MPVDSSKPSSFQIVCRDCDLVQRVIRSQVGSIARCRRCGAELYRTKKNSVNRTLALSITGLILFAIANIYPFLGFRIGVQIQHSTLITGILELYRQGVWLLASLVLLTTILVPAIQIAGMLYVFLPIRMQRRAPNQRHVFRWVQSLQPWGMMEVFMLGILVAIVKLAKMATIIPGIAVYAFMALIFVTAAIPFCADPQVVWEYGENR